MRAWISACLKKRAYSEATARRVVATRTDAAGAALVAYACDAGHWHVGHKR